MDELPPLFAAGQHLGRYELLQRLAVGGMAEVYLGYAVGPGDFRKVVAIKRLLPQHALDPQLLRMFLDEARLMARLSHPNIPQVTDVDDGKKNNGVDVPYFVMEYVHGTDLRGVLNAAAGPLPIEHALTITVAVAAGLHHAHEHRGAGGQRLEIVHRDVSPSNVLISFDGSVKVTDFGVAKWTEQKSFTHQGQLKGKFAHMSPEQCRGEALDRRSDVFALGTLLYEMTTGNPPFVAESEYELLTQIISQEAPPPRRPDGPYPADLAAIVTRSLGRAREDRYQSAQELQLALEAFAREHKLMVSPVSLAGYVESLFGARVTEWRQALASGKTLVDHLARSEGQSANAGGQAHAHPNERTATDAFVIAPPGISTATPGHVSPTAVQPRRKAGIKRTLVITGAAVVTVALLAFATELTSRWQRVPRPALSPTRMIDPGLPSPTITTGTRSTGQSTSPALTPTLPLAPGFPVPESIPAPTSATREPRQVDEVVAARPSRRWSATVAASSTTTASSPARITGSSPRAVVSPRPDESPPPPASPPSADPQQPVPAAAAESPASPPVPVKVWDPDSPVPP